MRVAAALIALCILLVSVLLAFPATHVAASSPLFSDDFEADALGSVPSNWTIVSGSWSVQQDGSHVFERTDTSTTSEGRVLAGSVSWDNYVYQADVKPGANASANGFQLIARYIDGSNYYSFGLFNNTWYVKKRVGGTQTTAATGNFAFTNQFYTLTFSLQGTTLSASINGMTLVTTTDTSLSRGMIGLSAKNMVELDNVSVTTNGTPPTPTATFTSTSTTLATSTATNTPTPTATNTPAPSATRTPTPTATSTPGSGGGGSSAGNARLTLTSSGADLFLMSLDTNNNGWQVLFNQALGGAITRTQEIDNGVATDLQYQPILHALVQSYVQTSGTFHANQDQAGQIIVLLNTPELVGIETISTNTNIHITWTYLYTFWANGQVYIQLNIANTGTTPVGFTTPDSVQINLDGMIITRYPDSSPVAWYAKNGVVKSPVPGSITSTEADLFGRTPTGSAPPAIGFFLDKFTSWAAAGAQNYGIQDFSNTTRGKDQWKGNLSSLAPGQVLPASLLLEFRRNMTQSQSVSFDADYRAPSLTVSAGLLASTDNQPVQQALNNGFNMDLGAYVISADSNHVNAQLNFPAGVTTRWAPRFKIAGWLKGAPTVTWNGHLLTAGADYNFVVDSSSNTLYLQLNFDVVSGSPGAGQQANAPLDIS